MNLKIKYHSRRGLLRGKVNSAKLGHTNKTKRPTGDEICGAVKTRPIGHTQMAPHWWLAALAAHSTAGIFEHLAGCPA